MMLKRNTPSMLSHMFILIHLSCGPNISHIQISLSIGILFILYFDLYLLELVLKICILYILTSLTFSHLIYLIF